MQNVTGTILHLQRLSTEDGPGIRTTVFFKGCPLHCAWCHNPESISSKPQVQWLENRCIGCDSCLEACPRHGLTRSEVGLQRDLALCTACGTCVEACPTGAMELLGKEVTVEELAQELLKDRAYFEKSGGGVTLSGGEPALQPGFAQELARRLKQAGIHVALDTCGLCRPETLDALVEEVDLVLFDLKLLDPAAHDRWTGARNEIILGSLLRVRDALRGCPEKALWVRTPLIPGATLDAENIRTIGAYLAKALDGALERWELCAFNNLCRDKYRRLGLEWPFAAQPLLSRQEMEQAGEWALASGIHPALVFVTGASRVEDRET